MPKICASINFYNDRECLIQCLNSLKDFELVICCDGKWKEFKDPNAKPDGLSYDGSRLVVLSYPNTVLLDCGNRQEESQTNICMREAAKRGFDYILQVGADEYVKGDVKAFLEDIEYKRRTLHVNGFLIKMNVIHITPENQLYPNCVRCFYDPMWIRLKDVHWVYYYAGTQLRHSAYGNGIELYHDDRPRKKERDDAMTEYQTRNKPREYDEIFGQNIRNMNANLPVITLEALQQNFPNCTFTEHEKDNVKYWSSHDIILDDLESLHLIYNLYAWKDANGFNLMPHKWDDPNDTLKPMFDRELMFTPEWHTAVVYQPKWINGGLKI